MPYWGSGNSPWFDAVMTVIAISFACLPLLLLVYAVKIAIRGRKTEIQNEETPPDEAGVGGERAVPQVDILVFVTLTLTATAILCEVLHRVLREDTWMGWYVFRNWMVFWLFAMVLSLVGAILNKRQKMHHYCVALLLIALVLIR